MIASDMTKAVKKTGNATRSLDTAVHIVITRSIDKTMTADYGHFADGSSARVGISDALSGGTATNLT
jgi:hypothetical protein